MNNLDDNVRYNLFSEEKNHAVGYLLNGFYYEEKIPVGELKKDGSFFYYMKSKNSMWNKGKSAGRVDEDVIVRNDGYRFPLVPVVGA